MVCRLKPRPKPKFDHPLGFSEGEARFAFLWEAIAPSVDLHYDQPYKIPGRRFRYDFAHLPTKTAIEIEGQGRHQSFTGYAKDCEKYNLAVLHGWTVLRLTTKQVTEENVLAFAEFIQSKVA